MKKILFTLLIMLMAIPMLNANASENGTLKKGYSEWSVADEDISIHNIACDYSLRFYDEEKEIAKLDFEGNEIIFQGDTIEAARIFAEHYYWVTPNDSDDIDYCLNLGNENNLKETITFTSKDVEYNGNFTISDEADQFFNAALSELQKRERFK